MKVIELTKGQVAVVDDGDFEYIAQWRWHFGNNGYATRHAAMVHGKRGKNILMHHEVLTRIEGFEVDHINGNRTDNRKCNLRYATRSQNRWNARIQTRNKLGLKGVYYSAAKKKYITEIMAHGKKHYIGAFDAPEEAKREHDAAAIRLHGTFARLN